MAKLDYNAIKWDDYFIYDTTSPTCLRRKVDVFAGKKKTNKARISRRCSWFGVRKLGLEKAIEMATKVREEMIEKLNTEGAGYTVRHGF